MYAVIKTSGRQWTVKEGDIITVNRLAANAGEPVSFDEVLLVGGVTSSFAKWAVRFMRDVTLELARILRCLL